MNPNDLAQMIQALVGFLMSNGMNFAFAAIPGSIAAKRGWPFWLGYVAGLMLNWVPALILFSILPPRAVLLGARPKAPAKRMDELAKEQERIDEAERRARSQPAPAKPAAAPARSQGADSAAADRAPLPPPPIQELPVDLEPDPLADAPRASLRGSDKEARGHSGRHGSANASATSSSPSDLQPDPLSAEEVPASGGDPDAAAPQEQPSSPPKPTTKPRMMSAGDER